MSPWYWGGWFNWDSEMWPTARRHPRYYLWQLVAEKGIVYACLRNVIWTPKVIGCDIEPIYRSTWSFLLEWGMDTESAIYIIVRYCSLLFVLATRIRKHLSASDQSLWISGLCKQTHAPLAQCHWNSLCSSILSRPIWPLILGYFSHLLISTYNFLCCITFTLEASCHSHSSCQFQLFSPLRSWPNQFVQVLNYSMSPSPFSITWNVNCFQCTASSRS